MPIPAFVVLSLLVGGVAAAPAGAADITPTGVWQSPGGNTRIRIAPCGPQLCGKVVWASPRAKEDAARAGHPKLIGMNLFEEFNRTGPNQFQGRVFVPDLNRRFSGRLTAVDARTIEVRGCLRGNVGCRTDRWTRHSA